MADGDDLKDTDAVVRLHANPHAAAATPLRAPSTSKRGGSKSAAAPPKAARTLDVLWGKRVGIGKGKDRGKTGDAANLGIVNAMLACAPALDGDVPRVALTNHRLELLLMEPRKSGSKWQCQVADTAPHESGFTGLAWSPCGRWLAYIKGTSHATSVVCICDTEASSLPCREVTCGRFLDHTPSFDPEGNYLYFISARHFHQPVEDVS